MFTEANDQVFQKAMFTLQFLLLHCLNKEAVKVADAEFMFSQFKACLPVFGRFNRTKYLKSASKDDLDELVPAMLETMMLVGTAMEDANAEAEAYLVWTC